MHHPPRGAAPPAELGRREERLQRSAAAKKALDARARAAAEQKDQNSAKNGRPGAGCKRGRRAAAQPKPKAQHTFTDPESRIMKGPDGFVQAYNAQAAVEPALQLIVGQALSQQANDKQELIPLVERVRDKAGQKVQQVLAASGYCP